MATKKLISINTILLCSTLAAAAPLPEQEPTYYQVDMIVYQHLPTISTQQKSQEVWPDYATISIPKNAQKLEPITEQNSVITADIAALSESETDQMLEEDPLQFYSELVTNDMLLNKQARLINKAKGYKILWHKSWYQPMQQTGPHLINISNLLNDANNTKGILSGTISIAKTRYYRVELNLELNEPASQAPMMRYRLIESRKIHEDKLNYFDHPRFSALLMIKAKYSDNSESTDD